MKINWPLLIFCLIASELVFGQPKLTRDQVEELQELDEYIPAEEWNIDWLNELSATNKPWLWGLSLHNLPDSKKYTAFRINLTKKVVDKLLAHPSPTAEGLYWAALHCTYAPDSVSVCRTRELVKRLMEIDADNLNAYAIYFQTELSSKTGMGKTSSEHWDWSYFDAWLERAVTLKRAQSYDFQHYSELFELLLAYAKTEGLYSYLTDAPKEWRVAYYIIDDLVYPWHGSMLEVRNHCDMSTYLGRQKAQLACRQLADLLLENSRSIWERSEALVFLANTYSKSDPEFIRYLREAAAWEGPIRDCLKRFHNYANKDWTVNYDAGLFVHEYESRGEIVALQNLADAANWAFEDDDSAEYSCNEIPGMPDDKLSGILGIQDPAWTWCRTGEFCDPPVRYDQ